MRGKTGTQRKKSHNKLRKMAKGYRGRRKSCHEFIENAVHKGLQYATRDRKAKKRDFRRLWITRISAASKQLGLSYSKFIHGLNKAEIDLDRKMLADMAVNDPDGFAVVFEKAKASL